MNAKQFLEQIRDDSMEDGNLWTAELAKTCIADLDAQSLELQAVREALVACRVEFRYLQNQRSSYPMPDRDRWQSLGDHCDAALKQSRGATP